MFTFDLINSFVEGDSVRAFRSFFSLMSLVDQ